jgi:phosphatidylserine/phosphatidylglycerophosphate/cardiolipin synthase-like enzyme
MVIAQSWPMLSPPAASIAQTLVIAITGSFNFTAAASSHNAENLLVIRDAGLAARYRKN